MLQAKTFIASNDEELNAVLRQVPEGAFIDLRIIGDYRQLSRNTYMLLMQAPSEIKILTEAEKHGLAANSGVYFNDITGQYGV